MLKTPSLEIRICMAC